MPLAPEEIAEQRRQAARRVLELLEQRGSNGSDPMLIWRTIVCARLSRRHRQKDILLDLKLIRPCP